MLKESGATLEQMMEATGWLSHSCRGFLAGGLKKRLGAKPVLDGVEATRRITEAAAPDGARVLILTTFDLDEYVYEALRVGASGFMLKDAPAEELVRAVRVGARVAEVPSFEFPRRTGASNLNAVRDGLRIIRTLAAVRMGRARRLGLLE